MWLLLAMVAEGSVTLEAILLTGYKILNKEINKEFAWVVDKVTVSQTLFIILSPKRLSLK